MFYLNFYFSNQSGALYKTHKQSWKNTNLNALSKKLNSILLFIEIREQDNLSIQSIDDRASIPEQHTPQPPEQQNTPNPAEPNTPNPSEQHTPQPPALVLPQPLQQQQQTILTTTVSFNSSKIIAFYY